MKIVVFGLSISSAWGNGHATLLRGLFRCLHSSGHEVHFYERDTPYYAAHRDATSFPYMHLHLYEHWDAIAADARQKLAAADAAMVTSYCPDARAATDAILQTKVSRAVFYDMDTPVTFNRLDRGEDVPYLPETGLGDFDLVLSYTGGPALERLRTRLHAREVAALYGWVDPDEYWPVARVERFAADCSYLGTYSQDRQQALEALLIEPARQLPSKSFVIGGAMYPSRELWPANIRYFDHVAPADHRAFYSSSRLTLNVTRGSMAAMGYCPSGRLFEAAACGAAILSDWWQGLEEFFEPGKEILIARESQDSIQALSMEPAEIEAIAARAKERTLDCHTAPMRAQRLLALLEQTSPGPVDQHEFAAEGA